MNCICNIFFSACFRLCSQKYGEKLYTKIVDALEKHTAKLRDKVNEQKDENVLLQVLRVWKQFSAANSYLRIMLAQVVCVVILVTNKCKDQKYVAECKKQIKPLSEQFLFFFEGIQNLFLQKIRSHFEQIGTTRNQITIGTY